MFACEKRNLWPLSAGRGKLFEHGGILFNIINYARIYSRALCFYTLSLPSPDAASHGRNDTEISDCPDHTQDQAAHPRAGYDVPLSLPSSVHISDRSCTDIYPAASHAAAGSSTWLSYNQSP
jgi:hypothetical protein